MVSFLSSKKNIINLLHEFLQNKISIIHIDQECVEKELEEQYKSNAQAIIELRKNIFVDYLINYYFYLENYINSNHNNISHHHNKNGYHHYIILIDLINQQERNDGIISLINGGKKSRQIEIRYSRGQRLKSVKQWQKTIMLSIRSYCVIFQRRRKFQQKLLIIVIICQHILMKQRKYIKG